MSTKESKQLILLGARAPEIVKLLEAVRASRADHFELLGFVDDDPQTHGKSLVGLPVLGGSNLLASDYHEAFVVNNVGRTTVVRRKAWDRLKALGCKPYTAVHPGVNIAHVELGAGVIVQENSILSPGVSVGDQTLVNFSVIIAHESFIGQCCFLAPGVVINSRVNIREGAFLGAGAIVLPGVTVGEWAVVGAGSVVIKDVPPWCTVFGNPARIIPKAKVLEEFGAG